MLFNSYPFLLMFLPVTVGGFFLLASWRMRAAAIWLVAGSLFFYAWWDVRFLGLLIPSILANYVMAHGLAALDASGRRSQKYWLLAAALAANLLLLGYFKYASFFLSSINAVFAAGIGSLNIILPLGISFFTFTQIAFLVDAARGEVRQFDFVHYSLFVSYFPHLIAGPILHYREMMPQFRSPRTYVISAENLAVGLAYLAIGLGKKCLVADNFAPDVGTVFGAAGQGTEIGALLAWRGALAYTLQLYFDFSGYCDMAVGLSRLFGIRLPFNFYSPYQAAGIIEFWRRWHMTLSRFLRDYLYIPLGGNRHGTARRYLNLMVTMLLGGLWHGANWTFVLWGSVHGVYLVVNHLWRAFRPAAILAAVPARLRVAGSVALTFAAVVVAWVVFRAPDLSTAKGLLLVMAGANGLGSATGAEFANPLAGILGLFGLPAHLKNGLDLARYAAGLFIVLGLPNSQQIIEGVGLADRLGSEALPGLSLPRRANPAWGLALGVLGAISILTFARVSEFLYFQF